MKTFSGQLLIASPFLGDGNFNKSVVLMVQHNEDGAFGLVLNRPTDHLLREVWQAVTEEPCESEEVIHCGGPVEGPLMALHSQKSSSELRVFPGVHFAASKENLYEVIRDLDQPYHVFSGYSGWGPQQLETELEEGAWFTHPAVYNHIFSQGETDLWTIVSQEIGDQVVIKGLNIKNPPPDPSWN